MRRIIFLLANFAGGKVEKMSYTADAEGHGAKILKFDDDTVLVPFSEREAMRLCQMVLRTKTKLKQTGDFPEEAEYDRLFKNLAIAHMMLAKKGKTND